ncbi:alpha/beta hydrolase [Mesorhizobium loti]|jgi:pimeloyl-ACP methyl ester carboxylesterase|uniref:Alpha/beta hydrolase n=1 Tax=Mesorhizobium jarvisii TaxID=1777867 RepID=A0A6M7TJN0_9HYPH|nr:MULTISPECIES: alpha/beta hydrolase [Mesorhizobium]AID29725.1 alpha/beta fold hydrolase [Mesorhizobium huakuii 7653R]MCH4556820.1 alpha/beta hydrolase [Mesorhizobium jarvisii]OBQ68517.1 alpha/beta hydrolase [Mesorhizobium loti]QKC65069.1 alpha/beta hydrolase [Mesorhizobium jarvisii]QKD10983.1 alpha/beta hydrolase [Mesorhizobium loti]
MPKTLLFAILASVAALLSCPSTTNAEEAKPAMTTETKLAKPEKSGLLPVNGLNYYYAVYGKGEPLLLLHGGLGSIDMFAPILPKLAENRTVIGIDLQGHGRTALGDRPFSLEAIGDDMADIVKALGYRQVDVMGYSLGGGVAFRMAVQHPETVRRLVLVSTGYAADGFYDEMRPQQAQVSAAAAEFMKDTPMYKSYVAEAPHPEDFPKLLDALGNFMRQDYDFSADVPKLKMPVMLAYGDSDMYKPEHEIKFYQMLGGGLKDAGWMRENLSQNRLAILPNRTHYDVFFAPELTAAALPFLNGETKVKSWDEVVSETE